MTDWLTHTFIATSLLMALVLLVREPVRRQFGPAAAYGLWLIPALRMLVPPLTVTIHRTVPTPRPLGILHSTATAKGAASIDRFGGWETLAVSVWLAGALAMLIAVLLMYRRQRLEVLRDSVEMGRLGGIRVIRSPSVHGPLAFGIFDRVIALPVDFDEIYDTEERRLALDHELAHHQAGDLIATHIGLGLLCLHWFSPLAWLSHRAFRFDLEAACDARVLDKVSGDNRAAYAQAIAKAASGGALLFAGALDRPRTLHRRLASMLTRQSSGRRIAGNVIIAVTVAAALPLTASWATKYVDVPAPTAGTGSRPAPGGELPYPDLKGVTLGRDDVAFMADDTVLIDSKRKSLDQLTAAERSKVRAAILKSQKDLARDRAELPSRLAEARREADRARSGEMKKELLQDREDMRRDLAEIDSDAAEMRANGEDPAKRKAEILRDLREAEATDIDKEVRETLEEANPARITAEVRDEEQQMARMLSRLNQLDKRW